MKRTIFVLIFLTVAVASPPFYMQWSESHRLNLIEESKQQARPIFGESLEKVLSKLKNIEPPSTVILYTGNTKSHLEPCGCYYEQSGGLSRRAYAIEQIRQCGFPTFVVEVGDLFDGQRENRRATLPNQYESFGRNGLHSSSIKSRRSHL